MMLALEHSVSLYENAEMIEKEVERLLNICETTS